MIGFLIVLVQYGAFQKLSKTPYRSESSFAEQIIPTTIRNGQSTIKTDQITHDFFKALSIAAEQIRNMDEKPILIDATGAAPLVSYHLEAKPVITPWLTGGLNGSQNLFDLAISRLGDDTLSRAWILIAPDGPRKHSLVSLEARGLNITEGYIAVATARAPHYDVEYILFKPLEVPFENY